MNKEEISAQIENDFAFTLAPTVTSVSYMDGRVFGGFFHNFKDSQELKAEFQYRFIPMKNASEFQREFEQTGKLNPKYSIIIDCAEVDRVALTYHLTQFCR